MRKCVIIMIIYEIIPKQSAYVRQVGGMEPLRRLLLYMGLTFQAEITV